MRWRLSACPIIYWLSSEKKEGETMNTTEGEDNQHHRPGKQLPRDFCSWRQVWRQVWWQFFWVELCSLCSVHFIGIAQATFLKVENVTRVQQSLSRQKSNVVKESMRKCTARVVVIVLTILWQVLGQRLCAIRWEWGWPAAVGGHCDCPSSVCSISPWGRS